MNRNELLAEAVSLRNDIYYGAEPNSEVEQAANRLGGVLFHLQRTYAALDEALYLIAGEHCSTYTGESNCVNAGRVRDAEYGADAWCDQCIARVALEQISQPRSNVRNASATSALIDPEHLDWCMRDRGCCLPAGHPGECDLRAGVSA